MSGADVPGDDRWVVLDGEVWRVLEVGAATTEGSPEAPCLVFDGLFGV